MGAPSPVDSVANIVYEDECNIKKASEREAQRKKEEPPSKTCKNGDKGGKGGGKGGGKDGTPYHKSQRRSSAPAASPSPTGADPKKCPQGNNASPEESNSKKRPLARMAKSISAWGGGREIP